MKPKKDDDMNAIMQTMLDLMKDELKAKNQQIDTLLVFVQKIACGETVTAAEAKKHLTLIKK